MTRLPARKKTVQPEPSGTMSMGARAASALLLSGAAPDNGCHDAPPFDELKPCCVPSPAGRPDGQEAIRAARERVGAYRTGDAAGTRRLPGAVGALGVARRAHPDEARAVRGRLCAGVVGAGRGAAERLRPGAAVGGGIDPQVTAVAADGHEALLADQHVGGTRREACCAATSARRSENQALPVGVQASMPAGPDAKRTSVSVMPSSPDGSGSRVQSRPLAEVQMARCVPASGLTSQPTTTRPGPAVPPLVGMRPPNTSAGTVTCCHETPSSET